MAGLERSRSAGSRTDAPLANPINDARDMAGALRDAGFAVTLLTDVDQRQFQLALREFGERLKAAGSGGAGLFYFAGHGVQIKGRNYLIPVRSQIVHEDEVAYAAVDAQAVLDKIGLQPLSQPPAEFAKLVRAEHERWAGLVKTTGFKAEE